MTAPPPVKVTSALKRFVDLPLVGESEQVLSGMDASMGLDRVRFYGREYGPKLVHAVQRVKITRGAITIYEETDDHYTANGQHENSRKNLKRGNFNGYMSRGSAKKCKRMLEAWMQSINTAFASRNKTQVQGEIYSTFCTMTLPDHQRHSDQDIKRRVLDNFIRVLKDHYGVTHYFWKAEPQANGRIHFHMLIDRYIDKEEFSQRWDQCTEILGYVSSYQARTGRMFPPATKIEKLNTDGAAISYAIKYLSKAPLRLRSITPSPEGRKVTMHYYTEKKQKDGTVVMAESRPIEGRVWGCSDALRECRPPVFAMSPRVEGLLDYAQHTGRTRTVVIERATVIIGDMLTHLRKYDKWLWTLWRWHHLSTFQFLYGDRDGPPSGNYYDLSEALTECYQ